MAETVFTEDRTNKVLTMQRVFAAPRDKVFAAFTTKEALNTWWGPRGWETTSKTFDFVEGGEWLYCMTCVDETQGEWFGQEAWGKAVYETIDEPNEFTYSDYFADAEGVINPDMPGSHITMQFKDLGDGTTEVISRTTFDSEEDFDTVINMGVEQGAGETWDRLGEYVEER